jgi:hypothetical protein
MALDYRFVSFVDAENPANTIYINVYNINAISQISATVTLLTMNNGAFQVLSSFSNVATKISTVVSFGT